MAYTYTEKRHFQKVIEGLADAHRDDDDVHQLLYEIEDQFAFTEAEEFAYETVLPAMKELGRWTTSAEVAELLCMPDQKRRIQMALVRLVKDGVAESDKSAEDMPTTYTVKEA